MNAETVSVADTVFMSAALGLAQTALADGEFPVGCVIADDEIEVARGHRTGTAAGSVNEIDHAEINALRRLSDDMPDIDRSRLTIYCTMEPCLMCFSAILLSGIGRIVYAYEDVMGGGTGCDRSGLAPLIPKRPIDGDLRCIENQQPAAVQAVFRRSGEPLLGGQPVEPLHPGAGGISMTVHGPKPSDGGGLRPPMHGNRYCL